jgi:fatty acid/phospholipid biosynthesis enzyme
LARKKRIAIDAMGEDSGIDLTIPADLHALERTRELSLHLVGNSVQIEPLLFKIPDSLAAHIVITHAERGIAN